MNERQVAQSRADLSGKALHAKQAGHRSPPVQPQRRAYTVREFCELYATSRSQAYVEIAGGRLRIRKVGRRTLIAAEDADAWFAACAVGPRDA